MHNPERHNLSYLFSPGFTARSESNGFPSQRKAATAQQSNPLSSLLLTPRSSESVSQSPFVQSASASFDYRSASNSELRDEYGKLRKDHTDLVARLLSVEQELRDAQEQKYNLALRLEKQTNENRELKRYCNELLEQRNELLHKMNDEHVSKQDEVRTHQTIFSDMEQTIRTLTVQNASLQDTVESLQRTSVPELHASAGRKGLVLHATEAHDENKDVSHLKDNRGQNDKLAELHNWLTSKDILPKSPMPLSASLPPPPSASAIKSVPTNVHPMLSPRVFHLTSDSVNAPVHEDFNPTISFKGNTKSAATKPTALKKSPTTSVKKKAIATVASDKTGIGTLRLGSAKDSRDRRKAAVPLLKIDLASDLPFDRSPPRV
jgi:hypothetical protein